MTARDPAPGGPTPLPLPPGLLLRWPHLPAFWPERAVVAGAAGTVPPFVLDPFAPPRFDGRDAPPLIVAEDGPPLAAGEAAALAALVARRRLGGPPGLPDPGGDSLGLPARAAAVVLDPGDDPRDAARAASALAAARATGRPVILARDPFGRPAAGPAIGLTLPDVPGARRLPTPLAPWTLLDAAASLHGADPRMAALAEAAGVPHDREGPHLAPLLARTRAADPFRRRPWSRAEALDLLADWAEVERSNRGVSAALGIARWKRRQVAAALAHGGGAPAFEGDPARAAARARAEGGAVVAWAASLPDAAAGAIRAGGTELRLLEDGFVRSRGLGARFLPGASYCLDPAGAHYDPRQPSGLESLLLRGGFAPDLLARAARLRAEIVRRGVSKYNLAASAAPPDLPPDRPGGREVILVPGQVEDDASVRLGGGAIRGNLDLLRAVRAARPDAFILYKPHPDLEAGFRRGRLRPADLAGLADAVAGGVPLPALLPRVAALHTLTSLSGFEAILRGVPVTCWGTPFYAGWGLTEDRAPLPSGRRGVPRTVDELVAATLILYPRYVDPVTLLPCPVEVMLDRLDEPSAWRISPLTIHRGIEGWVRGALARFGGRR